MVSRTRIVLVVAAVVAFGVAARLLPIQEWTHALEHWVRAWGALGGVAYGAIYVIAALLFVPGSVLTLAAGALFGVVWGTVLVSVASTTAAPLYSSCPTIRPSLSSDGASRWRVRFDEPVSFNAIGPCPFTCRSGLSTTS